MSKEIVEQIYENAGQIMIQEILGLRNNFDRDISAIELICVSATFFNTILFRLVTHNNYINHTVCCNRHCTVNGIILQFLTVL